MDALNIKYEDPEILLAVKPAGIATESRRIGEKDMVSMVRSRRAEKGENNYIGLIHRLDQPVGGLLLFAKTKEAASKLSSQLQSGTIEKYYQALLCGRIEEQGALTDYLVKDGRSNLSRVAEKGTPGARRAHLKFQRRKVFEDNSLPCPVSLVEIKLETGRHHQIRVQMAHHGFPLVGDRKYNHSDIVYPEEWMRVPALFAWKLKFYHPKTGQRMEFMEEPCFKF